MIKWNFLKNPSRPSGTPYTHQCGKSQYWYLKNNDLVYSQFAKINIFTSVGATMSIPLNISIVLSNEKYYLWKLCSSVEEKLLSPLPLCRSSRAYGLVHVNLRIIVRTSLTCIQVDTYTYIRYSLMINAMCHHLQSCIIFNS